MNAAPTPVARLGLWHSPSGREEFCAVASLDGRNWQIGANPEGADALAALAITQDAHDQLTGWRPTNGRWRIGWKDDYRYPPERADGSSNAPDVVVEITADELAELISGQMPRAAYTRATRTAKRHATKHPDAEQWQAWTSELWPGAHVSGRGRHHAAKAKPAPVVALPDPIMRASGIAYYPRLIGARLDVDVVRAMHTAKRSVLLKGAPGTGKTACLEAAFTVNGEPRYEYIAGTSDTEVSDFVGSPVPEPGGSFRWVDGPLLRAMENGVPLIIDEIALIDPRVLSVVYAATDGRGECYVTAWPTRGTVRAADGFGVHGACNPDAPGALMSEALLSRMTMQVEYETDYDLAERWVPTRVVSAARNLDRKRLEGEVTWSPQMRELLAYATVADLLDENTALANLIASAPAQDQPLVADVLARAIGRPLAALKIGGTTNA